MRNIIREPVETMKEVIQKSSRLEAFLKEQIIGGDLDEIIDALHAEEIVERLREMK